MQGERVPRIAATWRRPAAIWLTIFCLAFSLAMYGDQLDSTLSKGTPFTSLVLLATPMIGLVWLVALAMALARRQWSRLGAVFASPMLAFAMLALPARAGLTGERIRFEANRAHYEREIARLPRTGAPRFKTFAWGEVSSFVTAPTYSSTLVFDESDEIARPPAERSQAWRDRLTPKSCVKEQQCAVYESAGRKSVSIEHITGHYYVVTEMWE